MNRTGCKRCVGVQVKGPDDLEKALRLLKRKIEIRIKKIKQTQIKLKEIGKEISNKLKESVSVKHKKESVKQKKESVSVKPKEEIETENVDKKPAKMKKKIEIKRNLVDLVLVVP